MGSTQQLKPDRKSFAIASIILGFITAILPFMILLHRILPLTSSPHAHHGGGIEGVILGILWLFWPALILAAIVGLIGIILGIRGLIKGNIALVGVTIGIVSILFEILYLFQLQALRVFFNLLNMF
jgi:hypothetical protein